MDDFQSETDSDYTSYWRDWVGQISLSVLRDVDACVCQDFCRWRQHDSAVNFIFKPTDHNMLGVTQLLFSLYKSLCLPIPSMSGPGQEQIGGVEDDQGVDVRDDVPELDSHYSSSSDNFPSVYTTWKEDVLFISSISPVSIL